MNNEKEKNNEKISNDNTEGIDFDWSEKLENLQDKETTNVDNKNLEKIVINDNSSCNIKTSSSLINLAKKNEINEIIITKTPVDYPATSSLSDNVEKFNNRTIKSNNINKDVNWLKDGLKKLGTKLDFYNSKIR